jgi:hypothetical protein
MNKPEASGLAVERVVGTKVEEPQTINHGCGLDFAQNPWMAGVVVNRYASVLKQQRDQLMNLCGAVNPARDVDLDCPVGAVPNGYLKDHHVVGVPVSEEGTGLLVDNVDVQATGQDPRIAPLRQVLIE